MIFLILWTNFLTHRCMNMLDVRWFTTLHLRGLVLPYNYLVYLNLFSMYCTKPKSIYLILAQKAVNKKLSENVFHHLILKVKPLTPGGSDITLKQPYCFTSTRIGQNSSMHALHYQIVDHCI